MGIKLRKNEVFNKLANREMTADEMGEVVLSDLSLLPVIFDGVSSANKRIKNATAKILCTISYKYPEKLYSRFEFFVEHMEGEDTILKWLAIDTIANMASVDKNNKVDKLLPKYYSLLSDESMITAGHSIESLGIIAKFKPKHRNEITKQLFSVKTINRNSECRNILLGKCILALDGYYDELENKDEVIRFVDKEQKNSRSGTANKAKKFLKKIEI